MRLTDTSQILVVQLKSDFCGVECRMSDACYQLTSVLVWHWGARLRTTDVQTQANRVAFGASLHDLNVDDVHVMRWKCVYYATEGLRLIAEA